MEEEAPIIVGDKTTCEECDELFLDSFLLKTYDHAVCDKCKDMDVQHKLISKTEAKNIYQLKDVDIDKREPILKFISRKNPHNPRWGEMKLYLCLQVERRAMDIHGSLEKIEEIRDEKVFANSYMYMTSK